MSQPLRERLLFLTAQLDGVREPKRLQDALVEAADVCSYAGELEKALREVLRQIDEFVDENGEANFYTGDALAVLEKVAALSKNTPIPAHQRTNEGPVLSTGAGGIGADSPYVASSPSGDQTSPTPPNKAGAGPACTAGEARSTVGPGSVAVPAAVHHAILGDPMKCVSPLGVGNQSSLHRAAYALHKAVAHLGTVKDGKTLFEVSPTKDRDSFEAWVALNNAQKDVAVALLLNALPPTSTPSQDHSRGMASCSCKPGECWPSFMAGKVCRAKGGVNVEGSQR